MPKGIYKRTKRAKRNIAIGIRKAMKRPEVIKNCRKAAKKSQNRIETKKKKSKKMKKLWESETFRIKCCKPRKNTKNMKKPKTKQAKKNMKGHCGIYIRSLKTIEKIAKSSEGRISWCKGKHLSKKDKRNKRLAKIKRIEKIGPCRPGFNIKACEYFRQFDEEHNTKGHYALYGGGEYKVKELGYFLDYINFDLKLIIEWDEKSHYHKNGKLRKKDIIRQKEIQMFFPDFEFRRIRE